MSLSREIKQKRMAAINAYLQCQTNEAWDKLTGKKTPDPAKFFREKHKENPPNLTDQELAALRAKTTWGSERAENYDCDTLEYYRKLGR